MFRNICNICLVALSTALVFGAVVVPIRAAAADPIADKQALAAQIQSDIERTNEELSAMGERYNGAPLRFEGTEARVVAIEAEVAANEREVDRILGLVSERSASVYRRALTGESLDDLDNSDSSKLVVRKHYAAIQARRDARLLDQLEEARTDLATQRAAAGQARADADAERREIERLRTELEAKSQEQQQLLSQVEGELEQLVAEEMARRQAEAAAVAAGKLAGGDGDPNLAPPGPAAAQALAFAEAQMGKTYVYAADGPDHYDCSGLTMAAYRSAGVSLPHYSGAQYAALPHVPLDKVMPGDLIFWGRNASTHVALYYGNAQILESGGSGHDVHIGPIWGTPMGAARVLQ